ncbi:helix-turn-helix domain-containing protein [Ensifer adhaerens]|uniref:IclR family transcriptional regulator n=1 Tax=Ensifer adhaerens TaxID=106592 RepID=UPI001CBA99CC|nr:IclR family transcriptional regulator C-terminal domain-containing protein [Ensifer adhaerens]MBZ7924166.1 helix-turn-helix domain-containing protein [Ensifer adhaerens]UAX96574.1 helix-turn-helix domain-containing protein [Ensifer adhaerens]UAY04082.1 helix-turn-helix domain-containing protein [Ensifer adhaerens]UAY12068.1 helix-turn-helix domain-containing protein [Ensifer adhaerens]
MGTVETTPPLERYIRILESIAVSQACNVSEISQTCDLPIGTAHRLMQNLLQSGLIVAGGGKQKEYQLGQRLLRLIHAGSNSVRLAIAVQPILDELANRLSYTCFLTRLVGHKVISVAWAAPGDGLHGYVVPGHTLAPHVAASAKAILAFQSKDIVDKALSGPLPKLTESSKIDRADIEREYEQVRLSDYATCWNEMENGLGAIAVPVPLPMVGVAYSIGTAGLIDRLVQRPEQETVEILRSAVAPMQRALREPSPKSDEQAQI